MPISPAALGWMPRNTLPEALRKDLQRVAIWMGFCPSIVYTDPLRPRSQPQILILYFPFLAYLSALRIGLLVERGLGETKEPAGVPFLRGVSCP